MDSYNNDVSAGYADTCIGIQCDTLEVQKAWLSVQAEDVYTYKQGIIAGNTGNLYAFSGKTVKVYGAPDVSRLMILAPDRAIYSEDGNVAFYGDANLKIRATSTYDPGADVVNGMYNFNAANLNNYKYIYIVNTNEID